MKNLSARNILTHLINVFYREKDACVYVKDTHALRIPWNRDSFHFSLVTRDNWGSFAEKVPDKLKPEFEKRIRNCDSIFIYHRGEFAGYAWRTVHPKENEGIPPLTFNVVPGPSSMYFFDVLVFEAYRYRGALTELLKELLAGAVESSRDFAIFITLHPAVKKTLTRIDCELACRVIYRRVLFYAWKKIIWSGDYRDVLKIEL